MGISDKNSTSGGFVMVFIYRIYLKYLSRLSNSQNLESTVCREILIGVLHLQVFFRDLFLSLI